MGSMIPLFHCKSLDETLGFYRALGFEVTYAQRAPYLYAAVQHDAVTLHLASLRVYGAKNGAKEGMGAALVFVPAVEPVHLAFAAGLRGCFGRVPTAGVPRITRLRPGHTRFKLFDPAGNLLIYINTDEPDADYGHYDTTLSGLAQALDNAIFLRDTYANDKAAARALDVALQRFATAEAVDRARALAARAEIAVAMGERAQAAAMRHALAQIELSDADQARFYEELHAADALERWLTAPPQG